MRKLIFFAATVTSLYAGFAQAQHGPYGELVVLEDIKVGRSVDTDRANLNSCKRDEREKVVAVEVRARRGDVQVNHVVVQMDNGQKIALPVQSPTLYEFRSTGLIDLRGLYGCAKKVEVGAYSLSGRSEVEILGLIQQVGGYYSDWVRRDPPPRVNPQPIPPSDDVYYPPQPYPQPAPQPEPPRPAPQPAPQPPPTYRPPAPAPAPVARPTTGPARPIAAPDGAEGPARSDGPRRN